MNILIAQPSGITTNYSDAVKQLGAVPYTSLSTENINLYSGLILPGGGDIHPRFLHSSSSKLHLINVDSKLDFAQFQLLKLFIEAKKPILGICKGMQLINVHYGGTIIQHLSTASKHTYNHKDQVHKTINLPFPNNPFFSLYGSTMITNSAHHQGVGILGKDLLLSQYTTDEVVEGIVHESLPIIGVQWHPERMCFSHFKQEVSDGSLLLAHFLKLCSQITDIFD